VSYLELHPQLRRHAEEKLTEKQLHVFKLWCNGYGTGRISLMLGVSEATVRGHLRRAQQKLKPYWEEAA
jgi:DNA-binding CsgD family transcriptional regulator